MSRITINKATSIKDIDDEPEGLKWFNGTIYYGHFYEVSLAINDDKGTYCKPVKPYESCEFEELFNFGCHCKNYNPNKVILIKNLFPY